QGLVVASFWAAVALRRLPHRGLALFFAEVAGHDFSTSQFGCFGHQLSERGGDSRRGGHDGTGPGRTAVEVAREGARLSGDQVAGGYVPRRKAGFVVAVQAATADPAQVEGRRPAPPDVSHRR